MQAMTVHNVQSLIFLPAIFLYLDGLWCGTRTLCYCRLHVSLRFRVHVTSDFPCVRTVSHGARMKVEIKKTERLFDGFFKLDRTWLRHETPGGGMSPEVARLNVERGDGAAVLLVNR